MYTDILKIADYFIGLDGKGIEPMKLQRLVYVAAGWYLAIYRKPLFVDTILAAEWGPKIPQLDDRLRHFGNSLILGPLSKGVIGERLTPEIQDFLNEVWREYSKFSAIQMAKITHQPGTPWYQTRSLTNNPGQLEIRQEVLGNHYREIARSRN